MFAFSTYLEFGNGAVDFSSRRCGGGRSGEVWGARLSPDLIQARHITLDSQSQPMLSMMLAASPSVLVLSPSLVQHAYNPYSQLMPSFHSYSPWSSPLATRHAYNPFRYATQVAMPRHSVLDLLRRTVLDDVMEKMVERVPTWTDDEEGGTVSTVLDVRGVPAEALTSELDADRTTLTIRGASPHLRLEHSVALPTAADADKIALELSEDGRLLVRVEKPPAPPEPTQIPIVKRVVAEEKLVEAPPKDAAALETELDSKFAVAPSPEATATAEAEVAVVEEKAEAEAAA